MKVLTLSAAILAGAIVSLLSIPSQAALMFSANIGGNVFSCTDGAACDLNPATGIITTGTQTFTNGSGTITFLGSAQTQNTGASNSLDTTSFEIDNTGSAIALQISVGGTNFVGPVTTLSESGSGTFENATGSTIDLSYFADNANGQGGTTPTSAPGTQQANSGVITATSGTDSFSDNHTSLFSDPNLYSMTLLASGTLAAGTTVTPSQLTGRSQAIVALQVPEPGTLGLLTTGLVVLGLFGWKRRRNTGVAA